ncbi:glutamine--tRNA ligase/YqeY domain fusion protein [Alkalilimnicola sp. S0819]|uniref:glutamine--tRNA ligase/YqeY domain fusion protein n=1 Tax=Alkalilimnicola sp. S0819 TaxID=2613922 RepID=UPI0012625CAF|nr:glutamine--tRNA ligase/YqeY domain fusion protein [Alkalilimnicola sp. S0819]KAB7627667.1 glutamine--tRNA ligase/YqeY domain fusion protein [Alkalilimnicola sp. S0819]MPQ15834.1 glutamine--tRNA ligase/YqeY domain fusion protein [Alkalilimnicola sp. S0819]
MSTREAPSNFIRQIIDADRAAGLNDGRVATRFPPEPNGYLHIGHAKSICLNFGIARDYQGSCNLRFDDTNPEKENLEFVESIKEDVRWLGFDWNALYYASDYFPQLYAYAQDLIRDGKAYVCDLSAEQMREYRGTLTEPGRDSPYRNRSVEENLDLFARMRAGEFEDGERVLRAKIDMASPNINMRDPTIYRIRRGAVHHQTGEAWPIYPMYDYTHCLSDAIEGITHSLCTLEFEDHRPLYNWFIEQLDVPAKPKQIEFGRLNLEFTVLSKRKLTELVREGRVEGWDDPRMPTIAGLRRRGYPPAAIRDFCERIGVTKSDGTVEMALLENCVREELDRSAPRAMAVLNPLKVVLSNYPEGRVEHLPAANHPKDESMGSRQVPFTQELYIDRDDFMEVAPNKKFKRLVLGGEVRLRNGYVIRCDEAVKDAQGEITELRCSYDPDTLGSNPVGRKVKGVIHWVSASHSVAAEVRLYDRLFLVPDPGAVKDRDWHEDLNPESLRIVQARVEPSLAEAPPEARFQFEREGYFYRDHKETDRLVFNRSVTLRDTWAKIAGGGQS